VACIWLLTGIHAGVGRDPQDVLSETARTGLPIHRAAVDSRFSTDAGKPE